LPPNYNESNLFATSWIIDKKIKNKLWEDTLRKHNITIENNQLIFETLDKKEIEKLVNINQQEIEKKKRNKRC